MVAEASVNSGPRERRWLAAAAVLYAAAVAIVLFWPVHVDGVGGLFRFDPVLDLLGRFGIPAWASYSMLEFVSNAALFLPLGVLWALAVDRWPAVLRILRPACSRRRSASARNSCRAPSSPIGRWTRATWWRTPSER